MADEKEVTQEEIDDKTEEPEPRKMHGSIVMIAVPLDIATRIDRIVARSIPVIDLMADGALTAENAHITLLYIGKIANQNLQSVVKRVTKVAKTFAPFELKVRGTARYPRGEDGTVLVGNVEGVSLTTLHEALKKVIPEAQHNNQFRPNLALAYLKPGHNKNYIPALNESWYVDRIIVATPQKKHEIPLMTKPKRELIVSASSKYYELTPETNLETVINAWQKDGSKPRSSKAVFSVEDLWPYREYDWSRETARSGELTVRGEEVWVTGPARWDFLVEELRADGWNENEPLWFYVGRNGGAKVAEGNHRLAVARKLRMKKVPVMLEFQSGTVRKLPQRAAEEEDEPIDVDIEDFSEAVEEDEDILSPETEERVEQIMKLFRL